MAMQPFSCQTRKSGRHPWLFFLSYLTTSLSGNPVGSTFKIKTEFDYPSQSPLPTVPRLDYCNSCSLCYCPLPNLRYIFNPGAKVILLSQIMSFFFSKSSNGFPPDSYSQIHQFLLIYTFTSLCVNTHMPPYHSPPSSHDLSIWEI